MSAEVSVKPEIWKPGKLLRLTDPDVGYTHDKERVRAHLVRGALYRVETVKVHQSHSSVTLAEVPGVAFNTAHFSLVDERAGAGSGPSRESREARTQDVAGFPDLSLCPGCGHHAHDAQGVCDAPVPTREGGYIGCGCRPKPPEGEPA